MMLGKPHITTNNGAQTRILSKTDAQDCLCRRVTYKALADAIERLLDDEALCAGMGEAAKYEFDRNLDYSHFMERITGAFK